MQTDGLTPGTIYIAVSERETVTISLPPNFKRDVIESARRYHEHLEGLEIAKRALTNPDHESGNTALIREEIRRALIHLADIAGSALVSLAENEEAN